MLNNWVMSLVSSHLPFCISHPLPGPLPFALLCKTSCFCAAHWLPNNSFLSLLFWLWSLWSAPLFKTIPSFSSSDWFPNRTAISCQRLVPGKCRRFLLCEFGCACGEGGWVSAARQWSVGRTARSPLKAEVCMDRSQGWMVTSKGGRYRLTHIPRPTVATSRQPGQMGQTHTMNMLTKQRLFGK